MEKRNKLIEEAYLEHYDVLFKKAYGRLKNVMDAEDAVQEAFKRALQYYNTYNPEKAGAGAWISSMLGNVCNNIRSAELNKGMCLEFKEELCDGVHMTHLGDQLLERMQGHIGEKRDPNTRSILHMYYVQGAKPREIAGVVPIAIGRIWKTIHNFKKELVKLYGEQ